ncbi:metallophosphoesterase [Pseudonocardia benzenivorans]|uniref:Metallophosphoesterase n=1 Tax=Pseudonocardia benzenivorans TaxID=228005 RepID=A0ABW3VEC2_9PSEU
MFAVLTLLLVVVTHVYLYRRAVHDVFDGRRARRIGATVIVLLGLAVAAAFTTQRALDPGAARPLHTAGYLWLAVVLYATWVLVVGELVRLGLRAAGRAPDPERRRFLSRVLAGTAAVVALGTVTYGAVAARRVRTERRELLLDRLDPAFDGFTIAAISDVHLGPLVGRADLAGFVATINAAAPDAVAIVGDLVDGDVATLGPYGEPLRDLQAPAYFVTGNHEYYSGAAQWVEHLPTLGVRVLRNERVTVCRGGAVLHIAGCDDRTAVRSDVPGHGFDLDAALAGRGPDEPVVLLTHQPVMVDQAARADVDLQISGHTHGGQLWPLTTVALIDQPVLAGLTRVGRTWLYVTRGVGFWGPPVRVGSPPEITVLTLRAQGGGTVGPG